jgi:hypothetical protein
VKFAALSPAQEAQLVVRKAFMFLACSVNYSNATVKPSARRCRGQLPHQIKLDGDCGLETGNGNVANREID